MGLVVKKVVLLGQDNKETSCSVSLPGRMSPVVICSENQTIGQLLFMSHYPDIVQ